MQIPFKSYSKILHVDNEEFHLPKSYCKLERRFCVLVSSAVGYTMRDIRYKWNSGLQSVGISSEVELPQFRVLGHRQRQRTIHLSTGRFISYKKRQHKKASKTLRHLCLLPFLSLSKYVFLLFKMKTKAKRKKQYVTKKQTTKI